jgi:hypothetical protein
MFMLCSGLSSHIRAAGHRSGGGFADSAEQA